MPLFYLLIFLIPFPEYRKFGGIIGDMTLIKVVGICTIVYAIFRHLHELPLGFWPIGKTKIWFIWFFIGLFTVHFSGKVLADWSVHIALFYVIMVLVDSVEVVIKSFVVTVAAMLINCLQSWKGVYLYGYYSRPTGSFGDANYFALGLIVSIAMAVCLYKLYPKMRLLIICSILMLFFTLLLTASRGGILGLGIMVLVFLVGLKQFKRMFIYSTVIAAVSIAIAVNFAPETITRFKGEDHSTKSSTDNRIKLQIAGLNMVKANMLTGVGYGNFKPSAREYNPELTGTVFIAHNSYLSVAAELGLPIFLLLILLLLATYFEVRRLLLGVTAGDKLYTVLATIKISFIGYCCSIAFLTAEREKYLWLLIILIMALGKIIQSESVSEAEPVTI